MLEDSDAHERFIRLDIIAKNISYMRERAWT